MRQSLRVLIVDDQPRARQSLMAVVKSWLHLEHVMEAETGEEAVRQVEQDPPDVILMDARMPVMDGITATRLIKAKFPTIPVIVLSIYSEYRTEALNAGADLFLGKAEPVEHLLSKLASIAAGRDANPTSLT